MAFQESRRNQCEPKKKRNRYPRNLVMPSLCMIEGIVASGLGEREKTASSLVRVGINKNMIFPLGGQATEVEDDNLHSKYNLLDGQKEPNSSTGNYKYGNNKKNSWGNFPSREIKRPQMGNGHRHCWTCHDAAKAAAAAAIMSSRGHG
ncbi:hypothetical protein CEXT_131921 [Caerostris extrusa]|uniref:Uncharacterized protein n=1 Tax=Caerostris extrusa TaxID=172846 RepID=A0AAV4QM59_CAEEX|nr:hypothetical protein CEXT_131921 [Caerostris extrusa]